MSPRVYLDWNATTPPAREVVDAMHEAALEAWGNPSSVHADGRKARSRVEDAREAVAQLAGLDARDVIFTSGGTEANNLALRSMFASGAGPGGTLLTSRIEHPSIVKTAEALEREGRARVRWLAVTTTGHIDASDVERATLETPDVRGAAIQAVNHETGAIHPLADIAALLPPDAWLHVDAVQGFGKVPVATKYATTMSLAAHKMRGPKGIGALLLRPCGLKIVPLLLGGAQERGLRPGTVDAALAAGLTVAARRAKDAAIRLAGIATRRDALERSLVALGGVVNGGGARAPHVTNVSFVGQRGPELVAALDLEGISVSSGSACSAGTAEPSPVIEAMAGRERALSAVRFSLGELTTDEDVARAAAAMKTVLSR